MEWFAALTLYPLLSLVLNFLSVKKTSCDRSSVSITTENRPLPCNHPLLCVHARCVFTHGKEQRKQKTHGNDNRTAKRTYSAREQKEHGKA
jgi:hypothetical protein